MRALRRQAQAGDAAEEAEEGLGLGIGAASSSSEASAPTLRSPATVTPTTAGPCDCTMAR